MKAEGDTSKAGNTSKSRGGMGDASKTGKEGDVPSKAGKTNPVAPIELNLSGQARLHIYPKAKNSSSIANKGGDTSGMWDDQDRVTWYILGGNFEADEALIPKNDMDYVELSFLGLPKVCLTNIARFMNIPMREMADLVDLSTKTLERKKLDDPMDKVVSSQVIEMASTLAHGMKVFEDQDKLNRWLSKDNRALGDKKPLELLGTPTGIKLVNNILTRIEEGIFS